MANYTVRVERTSVTLAYPDIASARPQRQSRYVACVLDEEEREVYRSPQHQAITPAVKDAETFIASAKSR